jgi:hypothetical protein
LPSPDHADAAILSTVFAGSTVGMRADDNSITGDLLQKVM